VATASGVAGDRQYNGRVFDPGTDFHDYGARLYWPAIGRFVSADPLPGDPRHPVSINRYAYVMNNPLKYVDPSGLLSLGASWDKTEEGRKLKPYAQKALELLRTGEDQQAVRNFVKWYAGLGGDPDARPFDEDANDVLVEWAPDRALPGTEAHTKAGSSAIYLTQAASTPEAFAGTIAHEVMHAVYWVGGISIGGRELGNHGWAYYAGGLAEPLAPREARLAEPARHPFDQARMPSGAVWGSFQVWTAPFSTRDYFFVMRQGVLPRRPR
jgi:RHS repeat-associated protein